MTSVAGPPRLPPVAHGIGDHVHLVDEHGEALLVDLDAVPIEQASRHRHEEVVHAVVLGRRAAAAAHHEHLVDVALAVAPPVGA